MKKYIKYSDPGHGWLRVSIEELEKLGIADKITGYSYRRGGYAYLEEDCDLTIFTDASGLTSENIVHRISDKSSKIRSYASYWHLVGEKVRHYENLRNALLKAKNWGKTGINRIKNGCPSDLDYWTKVYLITFNKEDESQ